MKGEGELHDAIAIGAGHNRLAPTVHLAAKGARRAFATSSSTRARRSALPTRCVRRSATCTRSRSLHGSRLAEASIDSLKAINATKRRIVRRICT